MNREIPGFYYGQSLNSLPSFFLLFFFLSLSPPSPPPINSATFHDLPTYTYT